MKPPSVGIHHARSRVPAEERNAQGTREEHTLLGAIEPRGDNPLRAAFGGEREPSAVRGKDRFIGARSGFAEHRPISAIRSKDGELSRRSSVDVRARRDQQAGRILKPLPRHDVEAEGVEPGDLTPTQIEEREGARVQIRGHGNPTARSGSNEVPIGPTRNAEPPHELIERRRGWPRDRAGRRSRGWRAGRPWRGSVVGRGRARYEGDGDEQEADTHRLITARAALFGI